MKNFSAARRVLIEMLLMEDNVAVEDGDVFVELDGVEYFFDAGAAQWRSMEGMAAPTAVAQQLEDLETSNPEAGAIIRRVLSKSGKQMRGGTIQGVEKIANPEDGSIIEISLKVEVSYFTIVSINSIGLNPAI